MSSVSSVVANAAFSSSRTCPSGFVQSSSKPLSF